MIESSGSILLITGEKSWEAVSEVEEFSEFVNKNDPIRVSIGTEVPELDNLFEIVKRFRDERPTMVVAIGGGKIIDSAKVIAGLISCDSDNPVENISKGIVGDYVPKIVAMPTTAGSGSEATCFAVVYHGGKKMSYKNDKLIPQQVIFSMDAIRMQPRSVLVSSALDATCQAIESIWSISATESSKEFAFQSLTTIWKYMKNGLRDDYFVEDLVMAANLSGKAINISKTTAPHALSYGATMVLGIPHGIAVSILMRDFLKMHESLPVMQRICEVIGVPANVAWMEMLKEVNPPIDCLKKEMNDDTIEELLSWVNEERLSNNPLRINRQDVRNSFYNMFDTIEIIRENQRLGNDSSLN